MQPLSVLKIFLLYITLRVHRVNGQSRVPPLCSSLDLVMTNDPAINSYIPQTNTSSISFLLYWKRWLINQIPNDFNSEIFLVQYSLALMRICTLRSFSLSTIVSVTRLIFLQAPEQKNKSGHTNDRTFIDNDGLSESYLVRGKVWPTTNISTNHKTILN